MRLAGILRALRDLPKESCAEAAARAAFMDWLMTLPLGCPAGAAARMAVRRAAPMARDCAAVALFCDHLRTVQRAARGAARPVRRGGARARRAARQS